MITLDDALTRGHGVWRSFTCPEHDDNSPSARVNSQTGKWVCMVCHAKGSAKDYKIDTDVALAHIIEMLDMEDVRSYPESWWDMYDSYIYPYWQTRFSDEVIRKYRLGYDSDVEKPCYPLWNNDGEIIGPVHRNLGDLGPKYRYPKGSQTSHYLFGVRELEQAEVLVLVEGAMDVIAVREAGYDAVGSYGARLYQPQIELLQRLGVKQVLIAYDDDQAGRLGSYRARQGLGAAGILARIFHWDTGEKDLGEMQLSVRKNILGKTLD